MLVLALQFSKGRCVSPRHAGAPARHGIGWAVTEDDEVVGPANMRTAGSLPKVGPPASGVADFRGVTGGVYKARERIHRSNADLRLLATPTSRSRVADCDPNCDRLFRIGSLSRVCRPL